MAGKTATPVAVAECHGIKVPDSPFLSETSVALLNEKQFAQQEIEAALDVVGKSDRVLELGAGLGILGAVVARQAKPAKFLSFEANPDLIPHIEALLKLNRLGSKIELRNKLLISEPGAPETLPSHLQHGFIPGSPEDNAQKPSAKNVQAPTEAFTKVRKAFKPTVLILNIEGGEREFLRHADLSGIRAVILQFHPEIYGKSGMRECKAVLTKAGFSKLPALSSRTVWACQKDAASLAPSPTGGWSGEVVTHKNAVVVPPVEQGFVQAAGVIDSDGKPCNMAALWRNGRALTVPPTLPEGDLPLRKGTWLWGGVLWMHFGHFLAESTARLWAIDKVKGKIDGVLFIPKRPRNGDQIADYQQQFAQMMGSGLTFACAGAPERVERLIVPGQGFGLGEMSIGTAAYRAAMSTHFAKSVAAEGSDKLYISRSKLPQGRGNLLGEAALEKNLRARGYTIYHPEKHDLNHQIATYKAARKIVAAEGSALHLLAYVADPAAEVAIVVRRPSGATRNLERHLEAFMGKPPHTIVQLARSWKPLGKSRPRLWMGELDMPALQEALMQAGFIGKGKPWAPVDPADVQERLGDKFEEVA